MQLVDVDFFFFYRALTADAADEEEDDHDGWVSHSWSSSWKIVYIRK